MNGLSLRSLENTVEANAARYRGLIESQRDLIVCVDNAGVCMFANDAYCIKFGKVRSELVGTTFRPLVHPDDIHATLNAVKGLEIPPYRMYVEHRVMTDEGWRWLAWENNAIQDAQGQVVEIQAIGRDITERKLIEEQLVAQRDLAQGLAAAASLDVALPICLDIAIRVSQMDSGGVYLIDSASGDLNLVCTRGLSIPFIESTRRWANHSDRTELVLRGQPVYTRYEKVDLSRTDLAGQEGLCALCVLPILHQGTAIGCFNLASHTHDEVPLTSRQTLEIIIAQVGIVIARIQAEEAWRNSQQEWQALFNSLQDFLFVLDAQGRILHVNQLVMQRLGYTEPELLGQHVLMIHPPDLRDEAAAIIGEMVAGQREMCPLAIQTKNGTRIAVETKVVRGRWGNSEVLFGISRDITARKQAEAELQAANTSLTARLEELKQHNHEIVLLSEMGTLLQVCVRTEEAYEVIHRQLMLLFPNFTGALYIAQAAQNLVESRLHWGLDDFGGEVFMLEDCWALRRGRAHLVTRSDADLLCPHIGHPAPAASLCVPIMAQSETIGVLHVRSQAGVFTPANLQLLQTVTDTIAMALANLKLRETLRQQSIRDPLTRLFNRRYMEETLAREIARAARAQSSLGIIMLDIDYFKHFNDTYGHHAGDAVLREMSDLLQSYVRKGDIVCRYGGEEFVLVLPETSLDLTLGRAEQLREKVKEMYLLHHGQSLGQLTISEGIALFPLHGLSADVLLRAADAALYAAKQKGRDRVCVPNNSIPLVKG